MKMTSSKSNIVLFDELIVCNNVLVNKEKQKMQSPLPIQELLGNYLLPELCHFAMGHLFIQCLIENPQRIPLKIEGCNTHKLLKYRKVKQTNLIENLVLI